MGSQSHPPRLLSPTAMGDMEKAVCMTDHFDKIQKLPDPIPGVPNFRRVPGFKVYCCGQPTLEGFEKVLEKVTGSIYPKYRFASKTLMRILPDAQRGEVEGLIEKGKMTLDLYEILGVCTWIEPK